MHHVLIARMDIGSRQRGFCLIAVQKFSVDTWIKDLARLDEVKFYVYDYLNKKFTTEYGEPSSSDKERLSSMLVNQALAISADEWGL